MKNKSLSNCSWSNGVEGWLERCTSASYSSLLQFPTSACVSWLGGLIFHAGL